MKCPYCNNELIRVAPIASRCPNPDCPTMKQKISNNLWHDLIENKQTRDTIQNIRFIITTRRECLAATGIVVPWEQVVDKIYQIIATTKQDKKE